MRILIRNWCQKRHLLVLQNQLVQRQRWLRTTSYCLEETSGSSVTTNSSGFLRESYYCNDAWNSRLETSLLEKINLEDFFYDVDKRYQADKVISAIDVDLYANKITDEDNLEEMEELIHRLRRSPATADALPSTSYAVIRAFLKAGKTEDLMRILNDRWNYGIFVDFHSANILMDEFLKSGNNRDAAKVASLLMLEEDFGPPTSQYFAILSCLRYLQNPTPEPWNSTPPTEESEEEVKVRLFRLRNPYFDDHFDLTDGNQIVGKTLTLVSYGVKEDGILSNSLNLLGWALYGKWDKVEALLKRVTQSKQSLSEEAVKKALELCEKAAAEIDASSNKQLAKPKVIQFPGVNLDEKDLSIMWEQLGFPEYEKFVPSVKKLISSNQISVTKGYDMTKKTEQLLSAALAEREDLEIQEHQKAYEEWLERRAIELENQLKRFKTFEVTQSIVERKKELQEKEEVIFFFENEEEWMMRLPPDEQKGYTLSTKYIPINTIPFVKKVTVKKQKKKKVVQA